VTSEIILIGPFLAGKSTIGALLAEKLHIPQISLDKIRRNYYREIGFNDALEQEIRQKGGFLAVALYWSLFNYHAIERVLTEHQNCVFDFGAGPIVFESDELSSRIEQTLAPYPHVVRLLPAADEEESIEILRGRATALSGTTAQGFDWSQYFVKHRRNQGLAKYAVYTKGRIPEETCEEILTLTGVAGL